MSTLHALLIFVGIPLLVFAVVFLLVYAPSLARGPRYRPGQEWDAEPEWLGGPDQLRQGEAGGRQRLISHASATDEAVQASDLSSSERGPGGASATW